MFSVGRERVRWERMVLSNDAFNEIYIRFFTIKCLPNLINEIACSVYLPTKIKDTSENEEGADGVVLVSLSLTLNIFLTPCSGVSIVNFEQAIAGLATS